MFDEVVELVQNKKYGPARQMATLGLAKMKDPQAIEVLMGLLDDEDVGRTCGHCPTQTEGVGGPRQDRASAGTPQELDSKGGQESTGEIGKVIARVPALLVHQLRPRIRFTYPAVADHEDFLTVPTTSRPRIGDVIEIPTARGLAYAQCTHQHHQYGGLIRVFDRLFEHRPTNFEDLVKGPVRFSTFLPLGAAVRRGIFEIVGHCENRSS